MDSVTFQVLNKRSIKLCSGHCCSLMDKKPSIRVSKIGEPESEGLPVHPLQPPFIPLIFEGGSLKIFRHFLSERCPDHTPDFVQLLSRSFFPSFQQTCIRFICCFCLPCHDCPFPCRRVDQYLLRRSR